MTPPDSMLICDASDLLIPQAAIFSRSNHFFNSICQLTSHELQRELNRNIEHFVGLVHLISQLLFRQIGGLTSTKVHFAIKSSGERKNFEKTKFPSNSISSNGTRPNFSPLRYNSIIIFINYLKCAADYFITIHFECVGRSALAIGHTASVRQPNKGKAKKKHVKLYQSTLRVRNVLKCVRDHHIEIAMKQIVAEFRYFLKSRACVCWEGSSSKLSHSDEKLCFVCAEKSLSTLQVFSFNFLFLHSFLWKSSLFSFVSREEVPSRSNNCFRLIKDEKQSHFYFHFTRPRKESASGMPQSSTMLGYFVGVADRSWLLNLWNLNFSRHCVEKRCSSRTPFESFSNNLCWHSKFRLLTSQPRPWWHTSGI